MTGQKLWAIGEEVIATDFNNYVQTQVVAQFANVTARDAWGSPPNGALCVTLDTSTVWQRVAGVWVQLAAAARVVVGTPVGGTTSGTTETGSINTANVPAVPWAANAVVSLAQALTGTVVNDVFNVLIKQNGTRIYGARVNVASVVNITNPLAVVIGVPIAANTATAFTVTLQRVQGTGTIGVPATVDGNSLVVSTSPA